MSPLLVDEIGWRQVTNALLKLEEDLRQVEAALKVRRRAKTTESFPAAFLLSTFGAPQREVRVAK